MIEDAEEASLDRSVSRMGLSLRANGPDVGTAALTSICSRASRLCFNPTFWVDVIVVVVLTVAVATVAVTVAIESTELTEVIVAVVVPVVVLKVEVAVTVTVELHAGGGK